MSLHPARTRLAGVARELRSRWMDTKDTWRDAKCGEFEQRYLVELFDSVDNAVAAMEDLDKVLKKIRQDCEANAEDTGS